MEEMVSPTWGKLGGLEMKDGLIVARFITHITEHLDVEGKIRYSGSAQGNDYRIVKVKSHPGNFTHGIIYRVRPDYIQRFGWWIKVTQEDLEIQAKNMKLPAFWAKIKTHVKAWEIWDPEKHGWPDVNPEIAVFLKITGEEDSVF